MVNHDIYESSRERDLILHFIFDNLSPYPSISIHPLLPFSSSFHIDSIHRPPQRPRLPSIR